MSEAMSNREIEDVLTSIRRLVAQDGARPVERMAEGPAPGGRLILTESQRVDPAPAMAAADPVAVEVALPAPDFGRLEATIAELEAAVSASGGTWEGESPDEAPRASNVTDLYGRVTFAHRAKDAETLDDAEPGAGLPATADPLEADSDAPNSEGIAVDPAPVGEATAEDEAVIDEATLRALVAQIVREELQGQLGERITAQVRKLVRAEIARALDDRRIL